MSHRHCSEYRKKISGNNEASMSHSKDPKTWQTEHHKQGTNTQSGFGSRLPLPYILQDLGLQ